MKQRVRKCRNCAEELPTSKLPHFTVANASRVLDVDEARKRAKETPVYKRAEKLVTKNPGKYTITEDSFGSAMWWVLTCKVPHQSEEEGQIVMWLRTGVASEPD